MAVSLCRRVLLNYKNSLFQIQRRTGYVVLIPEKPDEVADFNFFSLENLPDFSNLSIKQCSIIFHHNAQQYDVGSWEINEYLQKQLKASEKVDVFKTLIEPLEVLLIPFLTSWGVTETLYVADRSIIPSKSFIPLHQRFSQIVNDKFHRKNVYIAFKNYLESDGSNCTEEQTRVIKKYITEGYHNGFELDSDKEAKLTVLNQKLENMKKQYESKYLNSMVLFKQVITEEEFKKSVPLDLLRICCARDKNPEEGPWIITLQKAVYERYMEYCIHREARYHIWLKYNQIASRHLETSCNATFSFEEVRKNRQGIAEILGFPSYAHLSIKKKMAGSVENVQMVLSKLLESARFGQEKEVYELEKFAFSNNFEGQLELWDLPYWKRKEIESKIGLGEEALKEYFPIGQVLLGLIALCEQLFAIIIEEQTAVDVWAPGVQYFRILDAKTKAILGGFYFDPYGRQNKVVEGHNSGWFLPIRPKSKIIASLPLCSLIFNFTPPTEDKPSLLYYGEIKNLFDKFGHMLQFILTQASYSDVSGLSNVEWDALDVCSNFMKFWLTEKATLESISGHYATGEPLPSHALENLCNIHRHMAGTSLSTEIYFANLDLYIHLRTESVVSLMKNLWPQHFLFSLHKDDCHPFGFKEIILTSPPCSVYGAVWSKMIAADIFSAFSETGFNNLEDIASLGLKLRSTLLSLGGGCDSSEVFRRFRDRDPDPKFLIDLLDLPTAAYFEPSSEPKFFIPESN